MNATAVALVTLDVDVDVEVDVGVDVDVEEECVMAASDRIAMREGDGKGQGDGQGDGQDEGWKATETEICVRLVERKGGGVMSH